MTQHKDLDSLRTAWNRGCTDLRDRLLRYVVKLAVIRDEQTGSREACPLVRQLSCFLLEVDGAKYIATAGHVLERLKELLEDDHDYLIRVVDGLHQSSRSEPYPLDLRLSDLHYLYSKDAGVDFGLIPLRGLAVENILRSGSEFLGKDKVSYPTPDHDMFVLIGTPFESQTQSIVREGEAIAAASNMEVLPILEEQDPPEKLLLEMPRFYGSLVDHFKHGDVPLNIDGMSGGPIFGIDFEWEGERSVGASVQLIGVQSGWLESKGVIAASLAKPFVDRVQQSV